MNKEEIEKTAEKYAIKNAFEHEKAQIGAVVGKVKALFPEEEMKKIIPIVKETVKKINELEKSELEKKYKKFEEEGWELKQEEKEKTLPELDWLKKGEKIITRVAPCPTGPMHFGHARPAIILDEYVKKYGGEFIIRFDDTDPKIKIPKQGIEEEYIKDFEWLGIKISKIKRQSDNIEKHLKIIEKLLKEGKAYICFCKQEEWRKKIWKSEGCACRTKNPKEQMKDWKKMKNHDLKEGDCVVRIKTDLKDKDSSVRDWWIAKIVDDPKKHPNKKTHKYHVWPSYNLSSAVDDHEMKTNFIVRGQEHRQNEKKQKYLYDYLGWEYAKTKYHGKIASIGDMVLSKSKIKKMMEEEGLERDDDPRLANIKSFRRRGFLPETIRKIILDCGLNPNDSKISSENLSSTNKKFLGEVKQYPFIEEGIQLEIVNCGKGEINEYGIIKKIEKPIQKFIIDKKETSKIKEGESVRLKEGLNFKLTGKSEYNADGFFVSYGKKDYKTINWITGEGKEARVLMNDGKEKIGLTTKTIEKEKEGKMINFSEIGYVKIEEKNGTTKSIFAHK